MGKKSEHDDVSLEVLSAIFMGGIHRFIEEEKWLNIIKGDEGNKTNCDIVHWAAGKAILKAIHLRDAPKPPGPSYRY